MNLQLVEHLNLYNILPTTQSGFRKGYSTATLLTSVTDDIVTAKDKGMASVLILIDLSKAFDTINFDLLLAKLGHYGVRRVALQWFDSYLRGRATTTRLCKEGVSEFSNLLEMKTGVPQGSILGPILFSVFTADLPSVVKSGETYMYADDIQYIYSFSRDNMPAAFCSVNANIENLVNWCSVSGLTVNPEKSQLIVFGPKSLVEAVKRSGRFGVDGFLLTYSTCVNNLGLLMDEQLSFDSHIRSKFQSAFMKLKQLYQIGRILPVSAKITFADMLVLSIFNYCDCVFGPFLTERNKRMIQRVQNASVRYCLSIPRREPTSHHINNIGWMRMNERQELHLACFVLGIVKNKRPEYLYHKLRFRHEVHDRDTRHQNWIDIPAHDTSLFECGFSYVAPKIINICMGENVVNSGVGAIKKLVKSRRLL